MLIPVTHRQRLCMVLCRGGLPNGGCQSTNKQIDVECLL